MADIIIVAGAPGSGKTTTSELLKEKLESPLVDFGNIRNLHLNRSWSNQSDTEEQMSFENLIFIVQNYVKYGYKNVIVNDLRESRVAEISNRFRDASCLIITLIVNSDEELKKRIFEKGRDSGFTNFEAALEWNNRLRNKTLALNEYTIDNTHNNPSETVGKMLEIIAEK